MAAFQAFSLLRDELNEIGYKVNHSAYKTFAGNAPHIEIFSFLMNDFSPILRVIFQAVDLKHDVASPRKDPSKYVERIFLLVERVFKYTPSFTSEEFLASKDLSLKLDFTVRFTIQCRDFHVLLSRSLHSKESPSADSTPRLSSSTSSRSSEERTLRLSDFCDTFERDFPSSSRSSGMTSSTSSMNDSFPGSSDLSSSSRSDPLCHSSARKMYTFSDYTLSSISSLDMQLWMDTFTSSKGGSM
eukprot:TRINITY_DN4002_c0_g1_i2.p1 TRINITY_DN4002_c0_g1~~TRINITY_DN4002_c0_g1_i2.p1  ORF type:complete len:243 (-),score=35.42 TRINITY_DN4002_c0_g1_i2:32-760(-)